MSGIDLSAGVLTISNGARTVIDTSGRMVSLLDSTHDYNATFNVTFPDFTKGWAYTWRWYLAYSAGSGGKTYARLEEGDAFITAPPQEFSADTVLDAAPAGANLVAALVKISRTTAPSTWFGQPIGVKPPPSVFVPLYGSMLMEAELGMARAMSLYINGSGNLVLNRQQSVGAAPGYTDGGAPEHTMAFQNPASPPGGGGVDVQGGEWAYDGTGLGMLVYTDPATMHGAINHGTVTLGAPGYPAPLADYRRTTASHTVGSSALPVTDPTDYTSVYSVQIKAKYGRAS